MKNSSEATQAGSNVSTFTGIYEHRESTAKDPCLDFDSNAHYRSLPERTEYIT